jgi:ATP-dependent Clp protease adaptor protein ClpS
MSQEILEKKPIAGETKPYPNYRVLLLNDNHNTFEHVEICLTKHIPGMSRDKAHQVALKVHNEGLAVVWVGPKEVAEMYHELLKSEGLTVSLEPDL